MPAGETVTPGAGPAHDVLGLGLLPQGKVHLVALLAYAVQLAAGIDDVLEVAAREDAVLVVLVVFLHIEIDGAVGLIGIASIKNLTHEGLLLDDVARGMGLNAGGQTAEGRHGFVETVGVVLGNLHGLQLFEFRLLGNLVLALIGIVLEVAHIRDIADVAHLIA